VQKLSSVFENDQTSTYETIEVTQEMVEQAAKNQQQVGEMEVLEMEEITQILNNQTIKQQGEEDNELVFIIQDCSEEKIAAKFKCEICQMEFVRKKNFENHMKKFKHDENEVEPASKRIRLTLTKDGEAENQLKQELVENPETKKCKTCGALYMNEKSLKLHEKRNCCKQESYSCTKCCLVFTDRKLFTEHTENHPQVNKVQIVDKDPTKKFSCGVCKKSFKMSSTLKDHERTHTGSKPYKCSICGRGFSQNTNLKQHLRRHTQIKPFKCTFDDCESSFVSKGELDSHTRKHTGDHPFKCDQCELSFTTSSSMVKHKRIHSGEKRYACEFCSLRFTALGTLRNHERTHTGEKPHKCQFCSRAFTQKSDLSAHERTHTGDRPYVCNVCNSAFHQSGTLKSHMKIHSRLKNDEKVGESSDQTENSNQANS
jgi:KRAB domain-containing zinc finger protein